MAGRTDNFPKNGKTSATPKLANITASKKFSPKEGPGDNMPEMRGTKPAKAQYTEGSSAGTPKADKGAGTNAAHSRGTVPTGEHHAAGHRAPVNHSEFHKLGSGHWKP